MSAPAPDPDVGALLEHHLPGLRAFVRLKSGPKLRDLEASTDLVQSVCLEVLEHADRFAHGGEVGFRNWLYRTALRKIADRYAFYQAKKRDVRRHAGDAQLLDLYATVCTPSREVSAREEVERVERAFDRLSETHRDVLIGARILGLSHRDLAAQNGRTEAASRTLLFRATARLVELLDAEDEGAER